jgi:acetyltransferase-like isoleucine patch superfamily enzyme
VAFGDDCTIDGFMQFHTFENMMLKVKRTHIQDGCTVAFGATVMGGAVIERDTTLLPLALVLKEMNLLTATYEGSPVERINDFAPIPLHRRIGGPPELLGKTPVDVELRGLTVSDGAKPLATTSTIPSPPGARD